MQHTANGPVVWKSGASLKVTPAVFFSHYSFQGPQKQYPYPHSRSVFSRIFPDFICFFLAVRSRLTITP